MQKKSTTISTALGSLLFLAACAKSPETIAPAYVSPMNYHEYSCDQLAAENARVEDALDQVSRQQHSARSTDTIGVMLLGLPLSTLSGGNVSDQVARRKGEQETLQRALILKKCGGPPKSVIFPGQSNVKFEPEPEPVIPPYTALPSGLTQPYEGTQLSAYSAADMRWFCEQTWASRPSPNGRTEYNPCLKPDAFKE